MSQFLYRRCCEEWENTHSFLQWVNSLFAEFLMTHISRENNICFSSMNEVTCQRCVIHNPRWKNTGRFRQEYTGSHRNMEAVFWPENFLIYSGEFRSVPGRKAQESDRKSSEKIRKISGRNTASMFRCIPAGTVPYSLTWVKTIFGLW